MLALRYSELLMDVPTPKLSTLLKWADEGKFVTPTHCVTDCYDLLELATGERGVPADKGQRLAVLSIREERLSGRCRLFTHIPTSIMLSDALTKLGVFVMMNRFLSTGYWDTRLTATNKTGKTLQITTRKIAPQDDFDEAALINLRG